MKTYDEGLKDGLTRALEVANEELEKAKRELEIAADTKNFAPNTIERTRVRRETAQRIAAAIRKKMQN